MHDNDTDTCTYLHNLKVSFVASLPRVNMMRIYNIYIAGGASSKVSRI